MITEPAFHHPPYSKVYYNRDAKKSLAQIFEKEPIKPDIVFSDHEHNNELYNYYGIHYIVSGGGGTKQSPRQRTCIINREKRFIIVKSPSRKQKRILK